MTDPVAAPRVAVVTGAASGIGRGVVGEAVRRGYAVVLTDRHADRLEAAAAELQLAGHDVLPLVADVSVYAEVEAVVSAALARHGRIDLLVNNAGIEATGYLWEMDPTAWGRVIDINTKGVMHGLRAALPHLLEQDGEPATIVNVASLASIASGPSRQSAYNASKHAVLAATECLRIELDEVGSEIGLHVVLPGPVASRIFIDARAEGQEAAAHQEAFDRFVTDEGLTQDQAAAMIFEGVDRGDFWITTHPVMFETFAARRGQLLVGQETPAAVPISA